MTIHEVEAMVEILKSPKKHGLAMDDFSTYFVDSETVTAMHELTEDYIGINKAIPKMVVYMLFYHFYNKPILTDKNGDLGYKLKFKQ